MRSSSDQSIDCGWNIPKVEQIKDSIGVNSHWPSRRRRVSLVTHWILQHTTLRRGHRILVLRQVNVKTRSVPRRVLDVGRSHCGLGGLPRILLVYRGVSTVSGHRRCAGALAGPFVRGCGGVLCLGFGWRIGRAGRVLAALFAGRVARRRLELSCGLRDWEVGSAALALTGGRSGRHDGDKGSVFSSSLEEKEMEREVSTCKRLDPVLGVIFFFGARVGAADDGTCYETKTQQTL